MNKSFEITIYTKSNSQTSLMVSGKSREELHEEYSSIDFNSGTCLSHGAKNGFVIIPANEISMIRIE